MGHVTSNRVITVMTQNVYTGADAEINAAASSTLAELPSKVSAVFQAYGARRFQDRAKALALQIGQKRPDLIGLQEAIVVWKGRPPDGPATPAREVVFDYVHMLLDALRARGLHYEVLVQSPNFDIELPSTLGHDVRHTDREVLLVRTDLPPSDFKVSNAQGANFFANTVFKSPPAPVPITFRRGWVAVDVKVRGESFRLISTHLDIDRTIQLAQVAEILRWPAVTEQPVIVMGDFNSPAGSGDGAYDHITKSGFTDAALTGGLAGGNTCCHPANLQDPTSTLGKRVDFILFRGDFTVLGSDIVGESAEDRTPSGLWPSDHAGVVAKLELPLPARCRPIKSRLDELDQEIVETQQLPEANKPPVSEVIQRLRRQREQTATALGACIQASV